jgi:Rad3-related DNA helicase
MTRGKLDKFELLCFNAAFAFKKVVQAKPHSLILTSGTLSPLETFEGELGVEFKHKLVNHHVINPKQVMIHVLKRGFDQSNTFSSAFDERDNSS